MLFPQFYSFLLACSFQFCFGCALPSTYFVYCLPGCPWLSIFHRVFNLIYLILYELYIYLFMCTHGLALHYLQGLKCRKIQLTNLCFSLFFFPSWNIRHYDHILRIPSTFLFDIFFITFSWTRYFRILSTQKAHTNTLDGMMWHKIALAKKKILSFPHLFDSMFSVSYFRRIYIYIYI